jgi:hypothetical protein
MDEWLEGLELNALTVAIGILLQVNKIFIEQNTVEPKVKALIPMYEPLETAKCEKCGKTIAQPKELIRIGKAKI